MAKMKIHELAKEVEKQSKEVIAFLQEKGIEAKAAQSTVEEDAAELVRKHFGTNAKKPEPTGEKQPAGEKQPVGEKPPAGEKQPQAEKKPEETKKPEEAPKKKKTIIVVSNPQNSRAPGQQGGNRPQGNGQNRNFPVLNPVSPCAQSITSKRVKKLWTCEKRSFRVRTSWRIA